MRRFLPGFVVTALLLASAAPAHAQTEFSCTVDGYADMSGTAYLLQANTAICAGILEGAPTVEPNSSFTSQGRATGDPCVLGSFSDANGDGTTLSGNWWSVWPFPFEISWAFGRGAVVIDSARWKGAGSATIERGGPGLCLPGPGGGYQFRLAFTATDVSR